MILRLLNIRTNDVNDQILNFFEKIGELGSSSLMFERQGPSIPFP